MTNDPGLPSGRNPHVETERVDVGMAHIDISSAEIVESTASRAQARYLAYALIVLFVVTIGIGAANLLYTTTQVHTATTLAQQVGANNTAIEKQQAVVEKQIRGDCAFYAHLSTTAIPISATNGKGSQPIVQLVSDVRMAWINHDCPGSLPKPDPTFVTWAAYYHLPVG